MSYHCGYLTTLATVTIHLFPLLSPRNIQLVLKISALQLFHDTSLSLLCPLQLGNDPLCSHLPGYTGPVSTGGKRRQVVPALWE